MSRRPGRDRGIGLLWAAGRAAGAGALATVVMDAAMIGASALGGSAFTAKRLDPQMIGRWSARLVRGRWQHEEITSEQPVPGELGLGIATHYATGAMLAQAFLLAPRRPAHQFAAPVAYGVATAVLPLVVLFPSLGYGWCGARSGEAARLCGVMLVGHTAFGVGLGIWVPRLLKR